MRDRGITPFLWFDGNAEEAVRFYRSVFADSSLDEITHYSDAGPGPAGSVMTISFRLRGQRFVALNAGSEFAFTPAISFVVSCETQTELDEIWEKLLARGTAMQCGWVTDRFGVSWQIVPASLDDLIGGERDRTTRVMRVLFEMEKIDIARLEAAASAAEPPSRVPTT